MGHKLIRKLPTPEEILESFPIPAAMKAAKEERDREIRAIIEGKSDKFLVIIGPCSAHEDEPVMDYVSRLAKVQDRVRDKLILVPRIYTNKPRTMGEGYKGMLHQPDPEKRPNMADGIIAIRKLHLRAIGESGLAPADEMLYPDNAAYCEDVLSYIAVGARSVENQQHRMVSSGVSTPIGMKNPTSGDLRVMFNGIHAAQVKQNFIYNGHEAESSGNPLAHAILRGYVNKHGNSIPNYHYEDLVFASELYAQRELANPAIIVDTNHENSGKKFKEQIRIAKEILHSRRYNDSIRKAVRGMMIESYIEEGSQQVTEHIYGKSITDPCLGWADSEELLYYMAENV